MGWHSFLGQVFKKRDAPEAPADKAVLKDFRKRYARFRKLLDANAALAELMAGLEVRLGGSSLFGMLYVRNVAGRALALGRRMARSLAEMTAGRRRGLENAVDRIESEIAAVLEKREKTQHPCPDLVLPLSAINLGMVDWVGGKNANLGEIRNNAGIPVPRGFAVTVAAFHLFLAHRNLGREIEILLDTLESGDREGLTGLLDAVRARIESAPLPRELEDALNGALCAVFADEDVLLAVRSSAQAEDGGKSFAGQFLTELGIPREKLSDSYRHVVASLFSPSATLYRLHQGIPLSASAMAVACLEMVDAVASGVAYSHDPVDLMQDTLLINGVWGLGRYAVDGLVDPDLWVFSRDEAPELIRRRRGNKERKLAPGPEGRPTDMPVPEEERRRFCLDGQEALELARLVMRLEEYYGEYQDVEWAKAADGTFLVLQSRPLDARGGDFTPKPPLLARYPLLLEGGDTAYPGVGFGPVVMPRSAGELLAFPSGGVLVAAHSSAEYAAILDRAQAVVTEVGGLTGHMATICREFRVPTILNARNAMQVFEPEMEVTVDAFSGRIYRGKVLELMPLRLNIDPVRLLDTPVHAALREVSRLILPLNLTDPGSSGFTPENCRTLHDVMRYAHELSYHEMFSISDSAVDAGGLSLKLEAPLPIDLHIIDLDNGVRVAPGARSVKPEEIVCAPLKALLGGMLRPEVLFRRPRPVNMGGFLSVMGQQMGNPQGGGGRFGDKSYAIISDRYMNFSSRVGYHYSVLDAYAGQTVSKNYVAFSFQGGAAGEVRRVRRIRAIALVLEALGFAVTVQGDMLKSRFQKYPREIIEDCLDQLGRLLQVTRQMDMLMVDEAAVVRFKDDFLNGIYR